MITQKTPLEEIIWRGFGEGWKYAQDLTASHCEVFE